MKHKTTIALFALLFWSVSALAATPKDTLVQAWLFDDIITMDPQEMFEISTFEILGNVYDTLAIYDLDDTSKINGVVAESWSVGEDGKTYTFKIRDGIKFHSGNPLTAHDVEFSFRRMLQMDASPAFLLTDLGPSVDNMEETVKAVDDKTFVLQVGDAFAPSFVLNVLTAANFSIVDKTEVLAHDKDGDLGNEWLKTNSAGSGAFILKSWKPNESVSVTSFDDYWRGAPALKRIVWRHIAESTTQRLLLEKGDVDIARNLPADQLDPLKENPDIAITSTPQGTNYYLGLNVKNEYFANEKVRQAMKYLVDYDALTQTFLRDTFVVNQTFLPYGFLGSMEETPFSFDPAKAKSLLTEAGYPDGISVTMDTRNTWPVMDMAQAIQATFKEGGVNLEILPADGKTTLTKYRARKHDIYIGRWGVDYFDPNSNAVFAANSDNSDDAKSKPLAWRNSWQDETLTNLAKDLVMEKDADKRAAGYNDMIQQHWERAPFVMMFQQVEVAAHNKSVQNFRLGPSSDTNFYHTVSKQ